ncbi:mediator of RNA polymerase II transcription subunit 20-like [Pollicipes pollicipes]|uniref:mediator of RNA polymerase II transcription subunit 20-like n=1 Tax=Pollicipes pollicipes TaxID=41117 RepID=UPI001884FC59|nr:mediator of RNA polymerase II transcription subunit 20-like [Pollicipes pollicipes]
MGFSTLQTFPLIEGLTGPQTLDVLHKRITALGARISGQFVVDCETYFSAPSLLPGNSQRILNVLHNTEEPASVFAILEGGAKQPVLVADTLLDALLPKVALLYTSNKKQTRIESKGNRYEMGDFVVKLGSVTMSGSFKGILVEVSYLACVVPALCWEMVWEFMQSFLGSTVPSTLPPYIQNRQNSVFSPTDTIQMYLEKFNEFRKLTVAR